MSDVSTLRRATVMPESTAAVTLAYPELPGADGVWQQEAPAGPWHDGYADGHAAGRSDAQRAASDGLARIDELTGSLSRAVAFVQARQVAALHLTAAELADAAVSIAQALVAGVVSIDGELAVGVARSLALVPPNVTAMVRVNPEDADYVPVDLLRAGIELVPDPAVAAGNCLVEIGDTVIDGGLASAVERVRAALVDGGSAW